MSPSNASMTVDNNNAFKGTDSLGEILAIVEEKGRALSRAKA